MSPLRSFAVVLLLGPAVARALPIAQVFNTNQTLNTVLVSTNATLATATVGLSSDSLAVDPAGQLFIADPSGAIWGVNGPPIPFGPTGRTQVGDLDWAPGGLWGYSNASQELFFYDLGLSSVTVSAALALPGGWTVTGVAYQPGSGDLYLSAHNGLNNDGLWRVPAALSSIVFVGSLAHADAFSYVADIDFDASGQLYAMTWYHRDFYAVNTATAATTWVSSGPHKDATGLALTPVPEAPSGLMLALGLLSIGWRVAAGRRAGRAAGAGSAPDRG